MSLIRLDFDDLVNSLHFLSEHCNEMMMNQESDSEIQKAINDVTLAFTILSETNYDIMNNILRTLKRPERIDSGTVGEFLFKDYIKCYGDVGCSSINLQGTYTTQTVNKSSGNPDQIWLMKTDSKGNKYYSCIVSTNSTKACIHIDINVKEKFEGLSEKEISMLKENNVKDVEIYVVGVKENDLILKSTPIDEVSVIKTKKDIIVVDHSKNFIGYDEEWGWVWLIVISIIVFTVIVLVMWW